MIEGLFNQVNYAAARKMLDATVLRHQAIASNLANLETPNYKRMDVSPSFMTELKQATAAKEVGSISNLQPRIEVDSNSVAANADGNTVQLENELVQLQQNTLDHTMETQLITSSLLRLRMAITGSVS